MPLTIRIAAVPASNPARWKTRFYPEGHVILEAARDPLTDGARKLLEMGYNPAATLMLVDPASGVPRLTAKLGVAAKLTVAEGEERPRFAPYKPFPGRP